MKNKLYIILVNFNSSNLTIDCIQSLRMSTYRDFQLVIVDNSNTSKFLSEIEHYLEKNKISFLNVLEDDITNKNVTVCDKDVVLIKEQQNCGFAAANNLGIKYTLLCKNLDSIVLLNNDTVLEKDALENLINAKNEKKDGALYGCKIMYYDEPEKIWYSGGTFSKLTGKSKHVTVLENASIYKTNFITFCAVLIPKSTIEKVGLMDESYFMYCEDLDYCYKVFNQGLNLYVVPNSVIYHKIGASSNTKNNISLFALKWGYRNEIRFNLKRKDCFKYISLFILLVSRPLIAIKWILKKRIDIAKLALESLRTGFF